MSFMHYIQDIEELIKDIKNSINRENSRIPHIEDSINGKKETSLNKTELRRDLAIIKGRLQGLQESLEMVEALKAHQDHMQSQNQKMEEDIEEDIEEYIEEDFCPTINSINSLESFESNDKNDKTEYKDISNMSMQDISDEIAEFSKNLKVGDETQIIYNAVYWERSAHNRIAKVTRLTKKQIHININGIEHHFHRDTGHELLGVHGVGDFRLAPLSFKINDLEVISKAVDRLNNKQSFVDLPKHKLEKILAIINE